MKQKLQTRVFDAESESKMGSWEAGGGFWGLLLTHYIHFIIRQHI